MRLPTRLLLATLITTSCLAVAACEKSRDEMRPDMDKIVSGEHGLQSRDLREMSDRMAPDLVAIPQIVQNPNRVTIVVKSIENHTEDMPGRNMDIYVRRLAGNLSQAQDRIAFVEQAATLAKLQNEELGNPDPTEDASRLSNQPSSRLLPQYALYGKFYSQDNGRTTYYLCQFQLTDIRTGEEVWHGQYETRSLN